MKVDDDFNHGRGSVRYAPGAARNVARTVCSAILALVVCALPLLTPKDSPAAEWKGTLQGGGEVTVDPRTNRATVRKGGLETQLWDGVHRLRDGSRLEVHSGQVIPNKEILRARGMPEVKEVWEGAPITDRSPCERLVLQVCGASEACTDDTGCGAARQLLTMEQRERAANSSPDLMTYTSGKCHEAAQDKTFFPACPRGPEAAGPSAHGTPAGGKQPFIPPSNCELLVTKACGRNDACAADTGCSAARQLLRMMEQEKARETAATAVSLPGSADFQCREALLDRQLFRRCKR